MRNLTTNDGVRLSYRVFGEGPKTVILIHGWMVSGAIYDDLVAALDKSGLRLVVPDLRGVGASDRPERGYTIERYADDILAVADAEGCERFTVVGHSMGGKIAQWIAATSPARVEGVALLCPVPAAGMPLPPDARALFRGSGGNRAAQKTILDLACKELSEAVRERTLDDAATISASCIASSFDAWSEGNFADKLGAVRAPTLVVATDDPFLTPAILREAIVARVAGARLAYLPGPGHYVQIERPRETAALLEAFIAALRS